MVQNWLSGSAFRSLSAIFASFLVNDANRVDHDTYHNSGRLAEARSFDSPCAYGVDTTIDEE